MKEASLLFCLPDNPFFLPKSPESHAVQEATYACKIILILLVPDSLQETSDCGWIFAQHFCNRLGPAYLQLKNVLDETDPAHAEVLNNIKRRFREETFTRESIAQAIQAHPLLVHLQYIPCWMRRWRSYRSVCFTSTLRWSTILKLLKLLSLGKYP